MYENARYFTGPDYKIISVKVDINGIPSFVPLDPANTDYQQIMALVEAGDLVIADPEPTGTTN